MKFYLNQIQFGSGKYKSWYTASIHDTRQKARNQKEKVKKEWKSQPFRIVQINVFDYEEKII